MPSVVLRHRGPSGHLRQALSEMGESFECTWSPGDPDRRRKEAPRDDFGFNICLLSGDDISRADAIVKGIEHLEELAGELAAVGQSLRGCIMDVGLFPAPDTFVMSTIVPASQCAKLAALGVDLELSVYAPSDPAS